MARAGMCGVIGSSVWESVANATTPTRTQPASISAASLFAASAANAVSSSNVAEECPLQNSSSMIDVDSSITKTTSAHGWQGSVEVVAVVVAVVVVAVVVVVTLVTLLVVVVVDVMVVLVICFAAAHLAGHSTNDSLQYSQRLHAPSSQNSSSAQTRWLLHAPPLRGNVKVVAVVGGGVDVSPAVASAVVTVDPN